MMRFRFPLFIALCIGISSCKTSKNITTENHVLPEVVVRPAENKPDIYRASNTISNDLVNTQLDVSFNWEKQYLYGKAVITLQPHFYATDHLWLNARGMEIKNVQLLNAHDSIPLKYTYANDSLSIQLNKLYQRQEQFRIYIDYISKPEELDKLGGSSAITKDKGLYFINPLGKDKDKPQQIWTQGESQANSVWFPTIDSPNQKMTQEIRITIDSTFVTLSNGLLIKSVNNGNGTRSDTWKQTLPAAPYLTMFTVGKFEIVKDKWRDKELTYYVEPAYKSAAKKIFGNTPAMLEFYSNKLSVDFPWEKYGQVIVRDYVSGAMENASASLFGEFVQRDERELLDKDYEDYVAHELFHQWFGDLVTAESWSNIPLHESFATYGEYLWMEHKYGRETADVHLQNSLSMYMREAKYKQVNLVRFSYDDQEDLFDRHTYNKGGCILNMLRKYVGDDAFYASLNKYLEDNKFKTVEIAQLRIAFETITGEDLNWFFNEWFYDKGHPTLDFTYNWDESKKEAILSIQQKQDLTTTPVYKIPLDVDIYNGDSVTRQRIILTSEKQKFIFPCSKKPDLINPDAEKMLVGVKNDHHSTEEWITLFNRGPLFLDRYEALKSLTESYKADSPEAGILIKSLSDKNWKTRELGIKNCNIIANSSDSLIIREQLMKLAKSDSLSQIRSLALDKLGENFKDPDLIRFYKTRINDASFLVTRTALELVTERDSYAGLEIAKTFEKESHQRTIDMICSVYSLYGSDMNEKYMFKAMENMEGGYGNISRIRQFGKFLLRCEDAKIIEKGLDVIVTEGKNTDSNYYHMTASKVLSDLSKQFEILFKSAEEQNDPIKKNKYLSLKMISDKYVQSLEEPGKK